MKPILKLCWAAPLAALLMVACGGGAADRTGPTAAGERRQALDAEGDESNSLSSVMRSCVAQYVGQGIPPQQALRLCVVRADSVFATGLNLPIGSAVASLAETTEPASVSTHCTAGDPALSMDPWAGYSDEALAAEMEYAKEQRNLAAAAGDAAGEAAWHEAAMEIFHELQWRDFERAGDGGTWPWGEENKPKRAQKSGSGACQQVSTQVIEVLMECSRVGWKSPSCSVFAARMDGCPDPRQAYVDPELGGLACQQEADPEAVREAWELECQRRTNGDVCGPSQAPDGIRRRRHVRRAAPRS